jgi:aspartate 1-decarboxylase
VIRRFVRSVIHNATVTTSASDVSLRLDPVLMRAMEVLAFEEVEIVNVATGARFSTWIEEGAAGEVAAHHMRAGDIIAIVSHGLLHDGQTLTHRAKSITVDAQNGIVALTEVV